MSSGGSEESQQEFKPCCVPHIPPSDKTPQCFSLGGVCPPTSDPGTCRTVLDWFPVPVWTPSLRAGLRPLFGTRLFNFVLKVKNPQISLSGALRGSFPSRVSMFVVVCFHSLVVCSCNVTFRLFYFHINGTVLRCRSSRLSTCFLLKTWRALFNSLSVGQTSSSQRCDLLRHLLVIFS